MIVISVKDSKTKKITDEVFNSIDKAKVRLNQISASKGKLELVGASYEESEERALIAKYLDIDVKEKR